MKMTILPAFLVLMATYTDARGHEPDPKHPQQKEFEKKFQETLSGATLVGHFTVVDDRADAQNQAKKPQEEKYTLGKVEKLDNDYWLFQTRIQYGDRDITLPLTLRVKWAGDTPVITVDDVLIPGLGTFSARVMIYQNQYAGTWRAKDHGGHLFGRIVREGKIRNPNIEIRSKSKIQNSSDTGR